MGVDDAPSHLRGPDVAALRHLAHPLECLVRATAQGVHQNPLGLVNDRSRTRRIAQLISDTPGIAIIGHGANERPAIGDKQLGKL
jgi:hypothetical protein